VVYEQDAIRRQVREALMGLSEKDREAVVLYYLDERTVEEVGRFLGVSGGAVKGRLHRARQHLRKELIGMVEETLSQKRLGPEFAERVELQRFSDLARLTDEELRKLMDEKLDAGMTLIYALRSDNPGAEALKARILAILPPKEREQFMVNLKYCDPVQHFQGELLAAARRLQRAGAIRPAPERSRQKPQGSVEIGQFLDFTRLTDEEIQHIFRHVDTKDLAMALKSQESGMQKVRERCFANVSERVRKLMEAEQTYGEITETQTREAQERIVKIIHRLQEAGEIRASKKG
jgi:flagellar motor switch protein FliG